MIPLALSEQLDELALFPDRTERIQALIELSEQYRHPSLDVVPRSPDSKIPGCESEVYFTAENRPDGTQTYLFGVDNPQGISAMALAVILEKMSGAPRKEVMGVSEEIVFDIFGRELSMGKNLGLSNMVRVLKQSASSPL